MPPTEQQQQEQQQKKQHQEQHARRRQVGQVEKDAARAGARAYRALLSEQARRMRFDLEAALERRRQAREQALWSAHTLLQGLAERASAAAREAREREQQRSMERAQRGEVEAQRRLASAVAMVRAERLAAETEQRRELERRAGAKEVGIRGCREAARRAAAIKTQRALEQAEQEAELAAEEARRQQGGGGGMYSLRDFRFFPAGCGVGVLQEKDERDKSKSPAAAARQDLLQLPGSLAPEAAQRLWARRGVQEEERGGGRGSGGGGETVDDNTNISRRRRHRADERGAKARQTDRDRAVMREVFAALDEEARRERDQAQWGQGVWRVRSPSPPRSAGAPRSPSPPPAFLPARALAASPVLRRLVNKAQERRAELEMGRLVEDG
jgi:hypothetical protein